MSLALRVDEWLNIFAMVSVKISSASSDDGVYEVPTKAGNWIRPSVMTLFWNVRISDLSL